MGLEKYEEKHDLSKRVIGEEICWKNTILAKWVFEKKLEEKTTRKYYFCCKKLQLLFFEG